MVVILQAASMVCLFVSVGCSLYAQFKYLRGGGKIFGLGFARYYYGPMRRERPLLFIGSLGGILMAFLLAGLASFLSH